MEAITGCPAKNKCPLASSNDSNSYILEYGIAAEKEESYQFNITLHINNSWNLIFYKFFKKVTLHI